MSEAESPGLHFAVEGGRGPYALLVHGLFSSGGQWAANLPALARVCRPVVVELWGHGRSPSPPAPAHYAPAGYVAAFERVRATVGAERWLLVGQSLGAALTLRYALDRPDRVIAHVFTNSKSALADAAWAEARRGEFASFADAIERRGLEDLGEHPLHPGRGRRLAPAVRAALLADYALHDATGVAAAFRHTVPASALAERLHENRVPTLLVAGRHEREFEPQRRFAQRAMPRLEVVEVDSGHAVNAEDVAGFDAAVSEFFGRYSNF